LSRISNRYRKRRLNRKFYALTQNEAQIGEAKNKDFPGRGLSIIHINASEKDE